MASNKILIVDRLNKYFNKSGKLVKVLDNVTFDVNEGDFLGIIGESGSGKSTIGKCIIRLYSSSSGNVIFDDKIINQAKLNKKTKTWLCKNMSMIFQDPMSSLNSRKNVLSLISEPLIINKVIQKEAKQLIKKCFNINSFFKNTYKWQDYNLTNEFVLPFLKTNIEYFKDGLKNVNQLTTQYENLEELRDILLTVENNYKSTIRMYSEYVRLIKLLVVYNGEKYDNNELHEEELKYRNAQEELIIQKMYLNAPKEYWELNEQLQNTKVQLDKYILDSHEKYVTKPRNRIRSIKNQYLSEIKSYKQNSALTDSITKNILEKTNCLILQDTIKAIKVLDKNNLYISEQEVQNSINFINHMIKRKYAHIIDQIANLNQLSEKIDLAPGNKVPEDEIKEMLNEYNYLYETLKKDYEFMKKVDSITNDSEFQSWVIRIKEHSNLEKTKVKSHISYEESKLEQIEKNMKSIKQSFLQEQQDSHAKVDKAKSNLNKAKYSRDAYFAYSNEQFDNNNLKLIEEQNIEIKNLKKELYELQKQFIKCVNKKFKVIIEPYKKDKAKEKEIQIIKKDIKIKSSTIDAINFEIDTFNEDVNLYRHLRTTCYARLKTLYTPLKNSLTRQYVYDALDEVGLKSEHAYRYPHEFSGGQRQRIVIARALISRPKLIIADEPISALDVSIQAQVINIMKDLATKYGITYLFIAHDLSMVRYTSNRLIILHKGKIVEKGNTDEVFNNPIHPYTKSLIKASPELSKIHVDLASFSSKLDYDKKYSENNMPKFFKIENEKEHYVLATESQFIKWTTKK